MKPTAPIHATLGDPPDPSATKPGYSPEALLAAFAAGAANERAEILVALEVLNRGAIGDGGFWIARAIDLIRARGQ